MRIEILKKRITFKGYEDWKRHQADKEVNNRKYELVSPVNGSLICVISRDIKVTNHTSTDVFASTGNKLSVQESLFNLMEVF